MTARLPLLVAAALLLGAAPALAKGGGGHGDGGNGGGGGGGGGAEIRVAGSCTAGVSSTLRLRSRDGQIRVDFELEGRAAGAGWRLVVIHERRVAWRTSGRTIGSGGAREISRTVRDYAGPDQVAVIASGPAGAGCDASATLLGAAS